jgi:hypothetical protein
LGDAKAEPVAAEKPYTGIYQVDIKDIAGNRLNIRKTPGGNILAELAPKDYVRGLGLSELKDGLIWVKIESFNLADATGWVAGKYLKRIEKLPQDVADARGI